MRSLTEYFLRENIRLSPKEEIIYGSDQIYKQFSTVGLELESNEELSRIVDGMRDRLGEYRFYVELNDYSESKVDSGITVILKDGEQSDREESYVISLSLEEQKALYRRLDEECRKKLGKSCGELLNEARKRAKGDRERIMIVHNTKNFDVREFECHCGCGFNIIDQRIIDMSQMIRDELGIPVRVNSGCRCEGYNARVGGVRGSKHMEGLAADLSCLVGAKKMFEAVRRLYEEGKLRDLDYCIRYKTFIHIDSGGKRGRIWEIRE